MMPSRGTSVLASLAASRLPDGDTIEPGIDHLHRTSTLDPATIAALSAHGIAVANQHTRGNSWGTLAHDNHDASVDLDGPPEEARNERRD